MAAAAAATPLREVRLYGALARKFGRLHRLAVGSAREAVQALSVVLPGFAKHLAEHSEPGYHVFIGKRGQNDIGEDKLDLPVSAREAICIVPVVVGSKAAGLFQVILGAALIAFSVFTGGMPFLAKIGASLLLGGVVSLIAGQRRTSSGSADEGPGTTRFDSPGNMSSEGIAVPLRYGRTIFKPIIVSQAILTEEYKPAAAPAPMPPQTLPTEQPLDPIGGSSNYEGSA